MTDRPMPFIASDVMKPLAERMGLDPRRVRDMTIHLHPNEAAKVTVTMYPFDDDLDDLQTFTYLLAKEKS